MVTASPSGASATRDKRHSKFKSMEPARARDPGARVCVQGTWHCRGMMSAVDHVATVVQPQRCSHSNLAIAMKPQQCSRVCSRVCVQSSNERI